MNSQSEICQCKNKEEGKLRQDRERQGKKGTEEGDTVWKCPIFWPSPLFQLNKENSASFFFSFLPPLLLLPSHPPISHSGFSLQKFSWMIYMCLVISGDFYRPQHIHQDICGVIVNFNAIMASDGSSD